MRSGPITTFFDNYSSATVVKIRFTRVKYEALIFGKN